MFTYEPQDIVADVRVPGVPAVLVDRNVADDGELPASAVTISMVLLY